MIRRLRVAASITYTAALVTATHWPGVTIEGPVPRPDLWVHLGAFGLWAFLAAWAWSALRRWAIGLAAGCAFAAVDESTQAFFGRQSSWTDFAADCAGICLGLGAFCVIERVKRGGGSGSSLECPPRSHSAGKSDGA